MMNALRTETENPGATHKLVCGCDILSPKTQSSRGHYDSFGNQVRHCDAPAAETSAAAPYKLARLNPYRYAAREWLSLDWSATSSLGLSDNRARFYGPTLAFFLQEDPLWNTNPYTYVGNNPISRIDPDGEDIQEIGAAVFVIASVVGVINYVSPTINNVNEYRKQYKLDIKLEGRKVYLEPQGVLYVTVPTRVDIKIKKTDYKGKYIHPGDGQPLIDSRKTPVLYEEMPELQPELPDIPITPPPPLRPVPAASGGK